MSTSLTTNEERISLLGSAWEPTEPTTKDIKSNKIDNKFGRFEHENSFSGVSRTYESTTNEIKQCPVVSADRDIGQRAVEDDTEDKTFLSGGKDQRETWNFSELSRRKKYLLVSCAINQFMTGLAMSVLAPFFPQVALEKGVPITLIGLTFSLFQLSTFLSAPFFGANLARLGPKFVLISGTFVGGACCILYGTLDKCPPGTPFIVTSMLCRCIEALGFSAYITSVVAIVSSEFPDHVSITFAIIETTSGIGTIVGPAVGGALYALGGFGLPFYVNGTLVLVNSVFMYYNLPTLNTITNTTTKTSKWSLLRNSMFVIPMVCVGVGSLGIAFLDVSLANHLQPFGLSTAVISLFFMIVSGLFTIVTPIYGFLSDAKGIYTHLIVVGLLVNAFGFFLVGPGLFIPFEMWTVIIGLCLIGCSFGCAMIPTMKCMIVGAVESGREESIETYSIVAGCFTSLYSIGSVIGPLLGGALIQEFGYPFAYTAVGMLNIAGFLVTFIFFFSRYLTSRKTYSSLAREQT